MSKMRQTPAFWSHLHYHPNNSHVGFVDERPDHSRANAADPPLVVIQVFIVAAPLRLMQPFIPGANSVSCGYRAAGTTWEAGGSAWSKLAVSRGAFVNEAAEAGRNMHVAFQTYMSRVLL